ncbi:MAG: hypothetical protein AAFQ10_07705 [Pseudomonadota bacterium]
MNRRRFLQSLAALSAAPALPTMPAFAVPLPVTVNPATYRWAETIVRAHNSCNVAMLQRHLRIDLAAAEALKDQLLRNGIISAQANGYGIHKAVKPLFEGAFPKPSVSFDELAEKAMRQLDRVMNDDGEPNFEDEPGCEVDEVDYDMALFDCLSEQAAKDGLQFARYGVGSTR